MEGTNQYKWQALEIEEEGEAMFRPSSNEKDKLFGVPRKVWFGLLSAFLIIDISFYAIPTAAHSSNPTASCSNPTVPLDIELLANVVLPGVNSISDLNPTTPQYRALEWLAYNDTRGLTIEDDSTQLLERFSLVTLFYALGGEDWKLDDDWEDDCWEVWSGLWLNGSSSHCDWRPVYCGEDGLVTVFKFNAGWLSGELPPEIGNFRNARAMQFGLNGLSGSIPTEIGYLQQLHELDLSENSFSGTIPSEIGNLQQLESLWLDANYLSGTIPSEIGNLQQLARLYLLNNKFSGTIPSEIGNPQQLTLVNLSKNSFSGTIPSEIGYLQQLNSLDLAKNDFSGTIPSEIGNLQQLIELELYNNNFSGSIPSEIGNLQQLTFLDVRGNIFSGTIPSEIQNMYQLNELLT